jgi:hypothetical protein
MHRCVSSSPHLDRQQFIKGFCACDTMFMLGACATSGGTPSFPSTHPSGSNRIANLTK